MFRVLSPILALVVLAPGGISQSRMPSQQITAPVKYGGTYHVATGTWSRANPVSSFNSDVVYNNSGPTGYFAGVSSALTLVDHGRLPSPSSPTGPDSVTGTRQSYTIDCFQLAYCTSLTPASSLAVTTTFYEAYAPCSDIDAPPANPVASFLASGLPAGTATGGQGCWIVSFDLAGSTDEFDLFGDADGTWNNDPNVDSFGWSFSYSHTGPVSNSTGPLIAGNCPVGGVTTPQRGFGTVFGGVPGASTATGLGTDDFFWIDDNGGGVTPNANGGCFFFGGCPGVPAGSNPYSSFWLTLFADSTPPPSAANYCSSLPNATGSAAQISADFTDPGQDLVLTATPVPNTTGLFFYGPMMLGGGSSLGDGLRCVGGMTTRLVPFVNAGMMMQPANTAVFPINYGAPYSAGLVGQQNFQYWFRSGMASGTGSNASDAISITF